MDYNEAKRICDETEQLIESPQAVTIAHDIRYLIPEQRLQALDTLFQRVESNILELAQRAYTGLWPVERLMEQLLNTPEYLLKKFFRRELPAPFTTLEEAEDYREEMVFQIAYTHHLLKTKELLLHHILDLKSRRPGYVHQLTSVDPVKIYQPGSQVPPNGTTTTNSSVVTAVAAPLAAAVKEEEEEEEGQEFGHSFRMAVLRVLLLEFDLFPHEDQPVMRKIARLFISTKERTVRGVVSIQYPVTDESPKNYPVLKKVPQAVEHLKSLGIHIKTDVITPYLDYPGMKS